MSRCILINLVGFIAPRSVEHNRLGVEKELERKKESRYKTKRHTSDYVEKDAGLLHPVQDVYPPYAFLCLLCMLNVITIFIASVCVYLQANRARVQKL